VRLTSGNTQHFVEQRKWLLDSKMTSSARRRPESLEVRHPIQGGWPVDRGQGLLSSQDDLTAPYRRSAPSTTGL